MAWEWIWAHLRHQPLAALAAVGVMVIVAVLVGSAVSWQRGLERAAHAGADPAITYLLARGSEDAVERSLIEPGHVEQALLSFSNVQVGTELVHMSPVSASNGESTRLTWRGVSPEIPSIRQGVTLAEGRWFSAAHGNLVAPSEVVLGQRVAREMGIGLGDSVVLLESEAKVVGIIDQGVGYAAGEIWLPLSRLQDITGRQHISSVVLRDAYDQATFLALSRPDLGMVEILEVDYLAIVAQTLVPLRLVAWIIAILLILAAAIGAGSAAVALADARRGSFAIARSVGVSSQRLFRWFLSELFICALVALVLTIIILRVMDGTVLRLGTIAPELRLDNAVLIATTVAVLFSSLLTLIPTLLALRSATLNQQIQAQ